MGKTDSIEHRLVALTAKMEAAQHQNPLDFDWSRPIKLPFWLPKRVAASAITRFQVGELATANVCHQIRDHMDISVGRDFLDMQARDEQRHAHLYGLYLDKLGGPDQRSTSVGRAYDQAASWQGAQQAIILAFHGVLEGESMRLQQAVDRWLPCPLFKEISAVIAQDEARHVAFGRLYLRETLPSLPRSERLEIFQWIRALWFATVRDALSQFAPPAMMRAYGGLAGWMDAKWQDRIDDLEAMRLFDRDEREEFMAAC
jgi:hypothetical protein